MSYGPNGVKRVKVGNDPRVTGLSDQSAAFVTAHCSPFTLPPDMDFPEIKVPKPGPVRYTESAYMHAMIQVPVDDKGNLFVVSNPNPLGSMPLMWSSSVSGDTSFVDPSKWATLYQGTQMEKVVTQMKELQARSSHFRVVGHGLKAWVASADAVQNKGMIEAGHFVNSDTGDVIVPTSGFTYTNGSVAGGGVNIERYPTSGGAMAQFLINRDYQSMKTTVQPGKTRINADLGADIGATVRWIAEDDFEWRRSNSHALLQPSAMVQDGFLAQDYLVPGAGSNNQLYTLTAADILAHWSLVQSAIPAQYTVKAASFLETKFGITSTYTTLYVYTSTWSASPENHTMTPGQVILGDLVNTQFGIPLSTATTFQAYAVYHNGTNYVTTAAVTCVQSDLVTVSLGQQPVYHYDGYYGSLYPVTEAEFVPPLAGTVLTIPGHSNSQVKFTQMRTAIVPAPVVPGYPGDLSDINTNVIGTFCEWETGTSNAGVSANFLRTFYPLGRGRSGFAKNSALWDMVSSSGASLAGNVMTHLQGPNDWKLDVESLTDHDYFYNIPFIDLTGALPDQAGNKSTVILQVVWQVEYVVPLTGMDYGTHNFVDVNWDALRSIVGDEEAFPVVVKGHSFFKNLWSAIKYASTKIEGVLGATSAIASVIPHPYAKAIGAGAGIASTVIGVGRAAFNNST